MLYVFQNKIKGKIKKIFQADYNLVTVLTVGELTSNFSFQILLV